MQKNIIFHYLKYLLPGLLLCSIYSCTEPLPHFPKALGRVDNLMVVGDPKLWNGKVGDTFKKEFSGPFIITPVPEEALNFQFKAYEEFDRVARTYRTIIFLTDLSNAESPTTKFVRQVLGEQNVQKALSDGKFRYIKLNDRWAEGQLLVFWFAPDEDFLAQDISFQQHKIKELIKQHDDARYKEMIYDIGKNQAAMDTIKKKYNIHIDIPNDYTLATHDSVMMWFRFETEKLSSNIFLHKFPAGIELTPDNLKKLRNQASKQYLSTHAADSYMYIDDENLPVYFQTVKLGNVMNALEGRGIWRMYNDIMGGSFISYLVQDTRNHQTLLLDVFVHYPTEKKRTEMRKLENILATLKVLKPE